MSQRHPIIAVTGSSGAGTTTVMKSFAHIFRREGITAQVIEGDSFHRYDRFEMRERVRRADHGEGPPISHFGPESNLLAELEPMLRRTAETLSQMGIDSSPAELGAATARAAWATLGWMVLLHAFLAQCAGLWAFGRLREPGLFGREFRRLRLGGFVAWLLVATFLASLAAPRLSGAGWQVAEDVLFVLAAAFLVQALAVVHGLRELQVIGAGPVVLAYVGVVLVPMALVGIGFADTWVRFRERFAPSKGV